ncbi:hypothetical protein QAD02_012777 [Eretmocerus hayati]|uniref:Uncharacterized protein n=1 Tax=Eretmocerus hayati TaxID=131215 RepID=A0ACC2P0D3_9HYME|nr:hypothetical protein QAD02_012777 [Eretmocerus hayati]
MPKFRQRWESSSWKKDDFFRKHQQFLDDFISVKVDINSLFENLKVPCRKRGGPHIECFNNASEKTKRRRLAELGDQSAQIADTLEENETIEPGEVQNSPPLLKEYFEDRALANFHDCRFTRSQYENHRTYEKKMKGETINPPYKSIQRAKKRCYPENIEVTENKARVDIQSLFDHTSSRLFLTIPKEVLVRIKGKILKLLAKWGMDGLSGLAAFKQKWKDIINQLSASKQPLDSSMFMLCMVPLKLIDEDNNVIWKNPTPTSTRYCRPIEFEFTKETTQNTIMKYEYYKKKMENLQPYSAEILGGETVVTYRSICSMIDGKTCNALTGQKCTKNFNLCNAKPSQLNDLKFAGDSEVEFEHLMFGLSPLHCRIRFMEFSLRLAYRQDSQTHGKKGGKENEEHKQMCEIVEAARKHMIQTQLSTEIGCTVDVVKTVAGTSNDGNTSRRFFEYPGKTARILGVNQRLIEMFKIILEVINCPREIDADKFKEYTNQVVSLYLNNYDWHPLPPSVHKTLMHGSKIIETLPVPKGALSEEAQECNNKEV